MTFFFLLVILGVTGRDAPTGFAPLAIGLSLTLIHLISIPVTNTSVNPARSTGPAVFVGGWALEQLWMFWVAPIVGAVLAGLVHHYVIEERAETAGRLRRGRAPGPAARRLIAAATQRATRSRSTRRLMVAPPSTASWKP